MSVRSWKRRVIVVGLLGVAPLAVGAPWDVIGRYAPPSGPTPGGYGLDTATDGARLVVGSHRASPTGRQCGTVYVFEVGAAGSAEGSVRIDPELADRQDDDWYGFSVDISGGVVAIGAPQDDAAGSDAGAVYLHDATTGELLWKRPAPSDPGMVEGKFGWSVGVSDGRVLVGAPQSRGGAGRAMLLREEDGSTIMDLVPTGPGVIESIGIAVAISDVYACVSTGGFEGAVYVFDARSGEQLVKIESPEPLSGDQFGSSIALDGGRLMVGAPQDARLGLGTGAAYLFDLPTGGLVRRFEPDSPGILEFFGWSVGLDGDVALVGALRLGSPEGGRAYAYSGGSGELLREIAPEVDGGGFGEHVTIRGGVAVVSAPSGLRVTAYEAPEGVVVPPCPGDIDGSGSIGLGDLNLVLSGFGMPASFDPRADVDGSGTIDLGDLNIVLQGFGAGCSG